MAKKVLRKLRRKIGVRLHEYRVANNIDAKEVCNHVGLTEKQLRVIEAGSIGQNLDTPQKILDFYGMAVDIILVPAPKTEPHELDEEADDIEVKAQEILANIKKGVVTSKNKEVVVEVIKSRRTIIKTEE